MHAHKNKAEVHSVLGVAGLHCDFMKYNGALTQGLKQLVEQGSSAHMGEQEMAFNKRKDKKVVDNSVSSTHKCINSPHQPLNQ